MNNTKIITQLKTSESIDHDKIILNAEGPFPRRIIIKDCAGCKKEYRLVKTQSGNYILNK